MMKKLHVVYLWCGILLVMTACGTGQEENEVIQQQKRLLSQTWQVKSVAGSDLFNYDGQETKITFYEDGTFQIADVVALPRISNGVHAQITLPEEGNWHIDEEKTEEVILSTETTELTLEVTDLNNQLKVKYEAAEPRAHDVFEATLVMQPAKSSN